MDIYQIATAYWDQVYEDKKAKDSQLNKISGLRSHRNKKNRGAKSTDLHSLKSASK